MDYTMIPQLCQLFCNETMTYQKPTTRYALGNFWEGGMDRL